MEQSAVQDGAAFEECYAAYSQVVYDAAIRLVGNHFEAEDVTQQVFLKVWSKPSAFRGGNFAAWLTTLAHNLSIDVLRRRRTVFAGNAALDAYVTRRPPQASVEDEVIREITAAGVWDAMRCLKPQELALVLASFMTEQSHDEIARSCRLPLGTVKTRIRTGLRRMRQLGTGLQ